jgi:peptide/nickel transport system ATP-binding protein
MSALLAVRDLSVDYLGHRGRVRAVDRVSFEVGPGEMVGLAGESGSGKSTLAQAALRILQPPGAITGGEVRFEDRDVLALDDEALRGFRWRKAAIVLQSAMNALNPVLTVGAQIADTILAHEAVAPAEARARSAELLRLVGIDPGRLGAYPHELSGGMRQRVVIAIALALRPPLLVMDEPTTALDVVVQKEILGRIAELKAELGFSVLFITHDLSLLFELCDRIGILYAGRLVESAPARELLEDPKHPYTRGLLASFPSIHGPRREIGGIPGSPPDLRRPPGGCRFHPRCPDALERCPKDEPALVGIAPARQVACHLCPGGAA